VGSSEVGACGGQARVPANLLTCSCQAIYPHMHARHVGVLNPDIRRDTASDHHTVTS
jgi:hypothetical protein